MDRFLKAAAVCSIAFFISASDSGAAWDFNFLKAKSSPRKTEADSGEKARCAGAVNETAQTDSMAGIGYTEFDGFNNIDDPLYREGAKVLLQKAIEADRVKAASKDTPARPVVMRDAPADIPAKSVRPVPGGNIDDQKVTVPPLRKNRLIKMIPADPLKEKSIL